MMEINKKDRNAAKRFWEHIKAQGRKTDSFQHVLTTQEGRRVEGEEAREYIRQTIEGAFSQLEQRGTVDSTDSSRVEEEQNYVTMETTAREWDKAESKVPAGTATGPDDIPMELIRALGKTSKLKLRHTINQIIMGGEVPRDWKLSKMRLIYKGRGNKDNIKSYRPITVTSVLYRLAMQIVKRRMEEWVEENQILGELQNGFRRDRRLEDNLFVTTQCIEIAMKNHTPLLLAHLDTSS